MRSMKKLPHTSRSHRSRKGTAWVEWIQSLAYLWISSGNNCSKYSKLGIEDPVMSQTSQISLYLASRLGSQSPQS